MNRKLVAVVCCLAVGPALFGQKKEDERLSNSAMVLQQILGGDKGLSTHILDQARCVLIYPSVKKVAIGFGSSYGRGVLMCRKGQDMRGEWGAPVMYALDAQSLGIQFGSTATDFVAVVMSKKGVNQILNGKAKLGSNAAAAAGPTGAEATAFNARAMDVDVLTYSRSKGLFAGVSLAGATMDADSDANRALYGKSMSAMEIVNSDMAIPAAAQPLANLLNKNSRAAI